MNTDGRPVGVLDSGLGGISVLRELVHRMPGEDYVYYGDSANAPYGTRTASEVISLTARTVEFLVDKGAKAIVVACNTATSVAIGMLRERYREMPIIGIEPALKPAVLAKKHSEILVMATPMTLREEKFDRLMHSYESEADIIKVPCPGLVRLIEDGVLEGEQLQTYLRERFAPFDKDRIDALVLGCTHYPLIEPEIRKALPKTVQIYDGGYGTAKEAERRMREQGLLCGRSTGGKVEFFNSRGTKKMLDLSRQLLELPWREGDGQ